MDSTTETMEDAERETAAEEAVGVDTDDGGNS
jgi:hypothetical protein